MSAHAVHPLSDPALADIRDRLTQQYALNRRGAPFWAALRDMPQEVTRDHSRDRIRLCNAMADMAEELGAVEHAQLIDGNTGCTPR